MHLLDELWTWLRSIGHERPDHGEGQIAIVVNGRSSSSEGGDAFPDDFAGWREFLEEEQRGPRCPRRFRPR